MAQKNATPTKAQQEVMKKNGLQPHLFAVVKELDLSMIVKYRITGEFKVINKKGGTICQN
ncbi:MAG: hypothetical protein IKT52_00405 [Oscillospiraceae bacterium]|nr:hypothetical protein [Oscillospiraceae bacterium]